MDYLARVEVDASRGLPGFEMVGLFGERSQGGQSESV